MKQISLVTLTALLFAFCSSMEAQQPANKVPRIGFLSDSSASDPATALRLDAFRQGLRELGYVEGKNIIVEHRYAEAKSERLTELAKDLARLKVMASSGNPIGTGVIASLARPGGNVTGLTSYSPELLGKRLELLKETIPKVSRFAFLNDASSEVSAARVAFKKPRSLRKL
jgi:putative tryptophan/tyrosine transport system substrate-binding protein